MAVRNVVTDTFARTVSSGWGNADTGQTWTFGGFGGTGNNSDFNVSGGFGAQSVPATAAYRHCYLQTVSLTDVDITATVKVNRSPVSGAPIEIANLEARMQSSTSYYLFRAQIETNQTITAKIFTPGGVQIASATVPGLLFTGTSQLIRVRAQSVGSTHRIRVWDAAAPEPVRWLASVTDSSLTAAGWVGVRTGVAGGNSNTLPVVASYDSFTAGVPYSADFPNDDLELLVYAAFGADLKADPYTWAYTNLSGNLLDDPVQLAHGRSDGATEAQPASFSCTLDNPDGRYTRGHPASPHWPFVRKNTPILVLINPDTSPNPVQFDGYASGWTPTWSVWARKPATTLSAAGVLQRLKQGTSPLRSPITRAILGDAKSNGLYQYWPCEDESGSTQAASALPDGATLIADNGPEFAGIDPTNITTWLQFGFPPLGTEPIPQLNGGGALRATFPAGNASGWSVQVAVWTDASDSTALFGSVRNIAEWYTPGGTYVRWRILYDYTTGTPGTRVVAFKADGTSSQCNIPFIVATKFTEITVSSAQAGANINVSITLAAPGINVASATFTGATLGGVAGFAANPDNVATSQNFGVGQIRVWNQASVPFYQTLPVGSTVAWFSYSAELATDRIARLCAEQGVPLALIGDCDVLMGPQGISTFTALMQECEDADGGQFYDGLTPGLGYITRTSRQNVPPGLSVDYSTINVSDGSSDTQVLVPTDDDQQIHNRWRVSRQNGSSATVEDKDGPEGVNAVDEYESSVTLNLHDDSTLQQQAAWRVHLGTVDGLRYPNVTLDFKANPDRIPAWLGVGLLLARITKTGLPPQHPPGDVDLIPVGRRQTIGRRSWTATVNTTPFRSWQVWEIGDTQLGRLGAGDRSSLHQAYAAGATSILVDTSPGPLWVTTAARPTKFPLDVDINGWPVHVTAISGASSPQTFTCDPLPFALPASARVRMWKPGVLAL